MTDFKVKEKYTYNIGFNSYHETEAIKGALPLFRNSPQKPPLGLYAEKLSGTAFTAPRAQNKQSWLYRILPSATHSSYEPPNVDRNPLIKASEIHQLPNQLRWSPFDINAAEDFISGLKQIGQAGDPSLKNGMAIYVYTAGQNMKKEAFFSADGDFLIVPQQGTLDIQTELGRLLVRENEIAVVPRGIRYAVNVPDGPSRGYILEIYTNHFDLPELGPIGSNCLANPRDFQAPVAAYDDDTTDWSVVVKFNNQLFSAQQDHSPFDVVAWHGNYYPYKYDLGRFSVIGSTSHDHPDPSIFTVLTCQSPFIGTAIADFVIFPPRWLVQEDTFRPPWYHRNTMSECMGLLGGVYDAKTGGGFQPGGMSLHNIMQAHGPDADAHTNASNMELKPQKIGEGSMAFMFESSLMIGVSEWGLKTWYSIAFLKRN